MSESDFEQAADVTQYGAWRLRQHRARLEQLAANAAELEAHRPVSDRLRVAHQGLFPNMSPTDHGAAVADRTPMVGQDFGGQGRPLAHNGGAWNPADHSDSPAPRRADLRPGRPSTGEMVSPTVRYFQGRQ